MSSNKNILSIETSSNICGISFISKGVCIDTIEEDSKQKHAEVLPSFYSKLKNTTGFILDEIDAIAISIGPGSFTGLRIGLSFAKGLAFSKNLPIIPVSTMMSLAYSLKEIYPEKGLIYSHAKRVFYQEIKWQKELPYPISDVQVYEWNEIFKSINNEKNIFQFNCELFKDGNNLIQATLSSSYIGLLASINYNKLVIEKPYDLVPNYVSPFVVKKKK
mgnify:CR=1 FL=1